MNRQTLLMGQAFSRQIAARGVVSFGTICILLLISSLVFVSFKLTPLYIENAYLKSALKSIIRHSDGVDHLSDQDIRLHLSKQLLVSGIESELSKKFRIIRDEDAVQISIKYEHRVPLLLNVDAVLRFENMIDSRFPDECCQWKAVGQDI